MVLGGSSSSNLGSLVMFFGKGLVLILKVFHKGPLFFQKSREGV